MHISLCVYIIYKKDAFEYYLNCKSALSETHITDALPPLLKRKVIAELYSSEISLIHILNDAKTPSKFILSIVSHLKPMRAYLNEIIIDVGDISTEIFFLSKGTVRLLQPAMKSYSGVEDFAEGIYLKYQEAKRRSLANDSETALEIEQRRTSWALRAHAKASRDLNPDDIEVDLSSNQLDDHKCCSSDEGDDDSEEKDTRYSPDKNTRYSKRTKSRRRWSWRPLSFIFQSSKLNKKTSVTANEPSISVRKLGNKSPRKGFTPIEVSSDNFKVHQPTSYNKMARKGINGINRIKTTESSHTGTGTGTGAKVPSNESHLYVHIGRCTEGNYFGDYEYYETDFRPNARRKLRYEALTACKLYSLPYELLHVAVTESGFSLYEEIDRRSDNLRYVLKLSKLIPDEKENNYYYNVDISNDHGDNNNVIINNVIINNALKKQLEWVDGNIVDMDGVDPSKIRNPSNRLRRATAVRRFSATNRHLDTISRDMVLFPNSDFKVFWDIIIVLASLMTIIIFPLQVAFYSDNDYTAFVNFLIAGSILDVLFLFDVLITSRTAYIEIEEDRSHVFVTEPSKIWKHYLKTWFWFDLIGATPQSILLWIEVAMGVKGSPEILVFIRFLNMFRLFRGYKMKKLEENLLRMEIIGSNTAAICALIVKIYLIGHTIACVWWLYGDFVSSSPWFDCDCNSDTNGLRDKSVFQQYVASLYWTYVTIVTVGYGDIISVNAYEMILNIFIMLLGCLYIGYVIGCVSNLVSYFSIFMISPKILFVFY